MKSLKISFAFFLFLYFFFPAAMMSQNFEYFQKSVLVDIPGDNYDFDLLSRDFYYSEALYLTWINKNDPTYTVYLKIVAPESIDSSIVISSDNDIKSNPQVVYNPSDTGISVFWENFSGSYYQIKRRDYSGGILLDEIIVKDSLSERPMISLNDYYLAWIMDNKLEAKKLYPDSSLALVIDSGACSLPSVGRESSLLVYEKQVNESIHIYAAQYNNYPEPYWESFELADGDNRNPDLGFDYGVSFESISNGISRIKYYFSPDPQADFIITKNTNCNYMHPSFFTYPIPTKQQDTPFFLIFDTDSLADDNEVMLKTYYYAPYDTLINISDMTGDDLKPKVGVMNYDGVPYVVIIWEHQDGVHSTIWMAKTNFHPAGGVKEDGVDLNSFELLQNYPNPFNPSTNIEYSLKQGTNVKVTIFDILGNKLATLTDGYQYAGSHIIVFDGRKLPSGIYFYTIEVNGMQKTKAMILMK